MYYYPLFFNYVAILLESDVNKYHHNINRHGSHRGGGGGGGDMSCDKSQYRYV